MHPIGAQGQGDVLDLIDKCDSIIVWDLRPIAEQSVYLLTGLAQILYKACDGVQSVSRLHKRLLKDTGEEVSIERIQSTLQPLLDRGLMMREGELYLSLATRPGEHGLAAGAFRQFQQVVNEIGVPAGEDTVIHLSDMRGAVDSMVAGAVR